MRSIFVVLQITMLLLCSFHLFAVQESKQSTPANAEICEIPKDYPVQVISIEVDPVYKDMLVPRKDGWLGSDDACSIPLSDKKILWLFGDTWTGKIEDGARVVENQGKFINNSIGIQDTKKEPPDNIMFYWDTTGGKDESFFPHQPDTAGKFYWPTMGTMLKGELFIFCYPVGFLMNIPDTTLIRVSNPLDPPTQWKQRVYDLKLGNVHQGFHSAIYVEEPYMYFLGYDDPINTVDERRTVLARVKTADLIAGKKGEAYEFWVEGEDGPEWGPEPEKLVTLFTPGVTETGIHYEKDWGLFICTTYSVRSPNILITTAPKLTGPWSKPVSIYQVPKEVSFDTITYAVKPHKELSTKAGEIIITYATNVVSFEDFSSLFTKEGLNVYYPHFLRVQLELTSDSKSTSSAN